MDQDVFKNFLFFLRRVGLVDTGGRQPSRHFVLAGRPKLWSNANFLDRGRNPLVTLWSSDVQNCGEMRILHMSLATLSSLRGRRTPKTVVKCNFHVAVATLSSLQACRASKTVVKCEFAGVLSRPFHRFVLIGRPKLW